jgi:serine/threonine-protein kinase ULK/ATG1
VADIDKKKDINKYTHEMVTNKVNKDFKGKFVNRKLQRENNENVNFTNKLEEENENSDNENIQPSNNSPYETQREKTIRIFKLNSSRILHERNKYVFLASVAERAISLGLKLSDVLGFVLIKKLFKMLCYLRYILQNKVKVIIQLTLR